MALKLRKPLQLAIYIRDRFTCRLCEKSLLQLQDKLCIVPLDSERAIIASNLFTVCKECSTGFYRYKRRFSIEEFQQLKQTIAGPIDLKLANKILEGRSLKWPNPWNPDYIKLDPALKNPKTPSPEEKVNRLLKVIDEMKLK